METKICNKCGLEKNVDNFYKNYNWYCSQCKECMKKGHRKWYQKNKNKIAEDNRKRAKEHYYKNRNDKLKYQKEYREKNKKTVYQRSKECKQKNREHYKKYYKEYSIIRRKETLFKFKGNIRSLIKESFKKKGIVKSMKTEKIVGVSLEELYSYLLQTFKNNYGYEWDGKEPVHIDHKNPLKKCKTEEEVIKCCHYTNLQLLKAKDNLKKGSKLNWKLEV